LLEGAKDKCPGVRYECIYAMSIVGDDAAILPALVQAALKDPDNAVRYGGQVALGRVGDAAIAALGQSLVAEKDVAIRRRAAAILEWLENPRPALAALKQAVNDPDPEVRAIAVRMLKQAQPP